MSLKHTNIIYLITIAFLLIIQISNPEAAVINQEDQIPQEAVRLRILANSNNDQDQNIKLAVRDAVNAEIDDWVADLRSIEEARQVITDRLSLIEEIARDTVSSFNSDDKIKVEFGQVDFPAKQYGSEFYQAGQYEAVVITIGSGRGLNWWCVLFPPLCFVDLTTQPSFEDEPEDQTVDQSKDNLEDNPQEDQLSKEVEESTVEESGGQAVQIIATDEKVETGFYLKELFKKIFSK